MDSIHTLEIGPRISYTSATDPLNLSRKLRDPNESTLANTSRERNNSKKLSNYYATQNKHIARLLKPVHEHVREATESAASTNLQYKIAVYASFTCNILLSALQLYGAIASGSLSLFTTMADSIFDPFSNITLIVCNHQSKKANSHTFPAGTSRLETAGNIFFAFIMMAVSLILAAFSCQELVQGGESAFHLPSVIAVSIAFGVKLALFLYCFALRNKYSQIRILWEDHRNDLFINGFGILTSVGGAKLSWCIDPVGATVLSLLILILWLRTSIREFRLLIGVTADADTLNLITYVSMTHSEQIQAVDTVRAYHSGPGLIVEVDVVMGAGVRLRTCHDVAEELQGKLESLPSVERAFVHVDYEGVHRPEHSKKDI